MHAIRDGDVLANYLSTREGGFGTEVKRRLTVRTPFRPGIGTPTTSRHRKVRTLIKADFDVAFEQADALVAPVSPTVAFPIRRSASTTSPAGDVPR